MKFPIFLLFLAAFCMVSCGKNETPAASADNTRADSMKTAMKAWADAVNAGTFDELDKYLATDMIDHNSAIERKGELKKDWLPGIKRLMIDDRKKDPESKVTIEDLMTEGDKLVCRYVIVGTKMVDSADVKIPRKKYEATSLWARWENGKFVELWFPKED